MVNIFASAFDLPMVLFLAKCGEPRLWSFAFWNWVGLGG